MRSHANFRTSVAPSSPSIRTRNKWPGFCASLVNCFTPSANTFFHPGSKVGVRLMQLSCRAILSEISVVWNMADLHWAGDGVVTMQRPQTRVSEGLRSYLYKLRVNSGQVVWAQVRGRGERSTTVEGVARVFLNSRGRCGGPNRCLAKSFRLEPQLACRQMPGG